MASLQKQYTDEKLGGQIYTPCHIVCQILDEVGYNGSKILGKKILEPACGDGRFLIEIVKRIIDVSPAHDLEKNLRYIYGWDIDHNAINACISHLDNLVAPYHIDVNWNIKVQNALEMMPICNLFSISDVKCDFDYIVGNPPYIRIQHLDNHTRNILKQGFSFCQTGSTDIYVAFFELAYRLLSDDGIAGYITPNSFLRTSTCKIMREFFLIKNLFKKLLILGHYKFLIMPLLTVRLRFLISIKMMLSPP